MTVAERVAERAGPILGIGVQGVGLGLGFASSLLLARTLGPDGFGIYGFAYSLVAFLGIPLHVGLATLLVKEVATYQSRGDHSSLRGIIRGSYVITAALSLAAAMLLVAFTKFKQGSSFAAYAPVIVAAAALLPLMALGAIRGGILRGLGHPIAGQLPDAIIRPLLFVGALAATLLFGEQALRPALAMALHVGAAAVAFGFGLIAARRLLPPGLAAVTPSYAWRPWLTALLPLSLLAGIQSVSTVVASLALGLLHDPAQLGFYRSAELGATLVSTPLSAVAVYAAGRVATLQAEDATDSLQREVRNMARIALWCAAPVGLVLALFGRQLLALGLGPEYAPAAIPLAILCIAQIANSGVGIVGVVMNMSGRYTETARAFAIALGAQVVLTLVLVPTFSAVGAAIASAVGTLLWSQILRHRIKSMFGISTTPF